MALRESILFFFFQVLSMYTLIILWALKQKKIIFYLSRELFREVISVYSIYNLDMIIYNRHNNSDIYAFFEWMSVKIDNSFFPFQVRHVIFLYFNKNVQCL